MKNGYFTKYTKSLYSRGAIRTRDLIFEGIKANSCIYCGKTLERKKLLNGNIETNHDFYKRKSCGKYFDFNKNKYVMSECMLNGLKGKNNPNYKNGLPKCINCGEYTKWYRQNKIKKNNHTNPQNYCLKCYREIAIKNFKSEKMRKLNSNLAKTKLLDYQYKLGNIPFNKKIYD